MATPSLSYAFYPATKPIAKAAPLGTLAGTQTQTQAPYGMPAGLVPGNSDPASSPDAQLPTDAPLPASDREDGEAREVLAGPQRPGSRPRLTERGLQVILRSTAHDTLPCATQRRSRILLNRCIDCNTSI